MVPVFLAALTTEAFIIYAVITSFTLRLGVDWFFVFTTVIWICYLVLPTIGAVYAAAIASEEVSV
jgi:hypothetical protein